MEAAAQGGGGDGHERSDLHKAAGEVGDGGGGDAKRPREGDLNSIASILKYVEEEEEKGQELGPFNPFAEGAFYREEWVSFYGQNGAKFEDATEQPPMRHTYGPVLPTHVEPMETMEVFYVKVTGIAGGLQWPVAVYGDVAVRDSLDHMRIYLFRRSRDHCQTLTSPQDSLLELTGPSRAIILLDHPIVEIDLKVKGTESPSEDEVLCCDLFGYNHISYEGKTSSARTKVVSSENSTIEVRFAHLTFSLEATLHLRLVSGPGNFKARLTATTASIGEEVVLLDSQDREMAVGEDGTVALQRRVVVVEDGGKLILCVEATMVGETESSNKVVRTLSFPPRSALRSEKCFAVESSILQMTVAWSLLP
ncbi:hypothetical protein ACP70R_019994 [Stipagrostis hirtigluma subsp. patula]